VKPTRVQLANANDAPPTNRCYWVVPDKFLAGAYPGSAKPDEHRNRIEALWNSGVRTFVNLVEEDESNNSGQPFARYDDILRDLAAVANTQVAHLRFPVKEVSIPSIDRMRSILDAIDLSLAAGRPVYVHCFGGIGRTGTVVCCWLLRHGLSTPGEVLGHLRALRQADEVRRDRMSPETKAQIEFACDWPEYGCWPGAGMNRLTMEVG
jgi:hypothetical protein